MSRDGLEVELQAPMLRSLLATLLCRPNRPVGYASLVAALWRDHPPRTARKTLSIYVHRLRRALGPERLAIVSGVGYCLRVDDHELDATEFATLAAEAAAARARGDLGQASSLAAQALALWRGPAFAGVEDNEVVRVEGTRLEEMRLSTVESWAETELALGHHHEVAGELLPLMAGKPYRESLAATLMLALYRCGRQAESLEVYRDTDRLLLSELGIRPGPELQRLHQRILREDADLLLPPRPAAASQVRVRDTLPPDLPEFTGRAGELDRLGRALHVGTPVVISAIEGMAGVGKTRLAVHAAHKLLEQKAFERVLFVNLRGFHPDPASPPADPAAVLDGFLRLLGVPDKQVPHDLPARVAAYRERLAGTQTLVVLDNAADAEQVRPLLPATAGCLTLVTSRRSLTGLNAHRLTVDVFTSEEAQAFLTRCTPEVAVGPDPRAPARIAQRCGHLPLALGLIAGHIRGTPGWTLTDHADRLDERHHHRGLDTGVEVALDLSYQHLPAGHRRLLRLAALHPGQDFDLRAAAALAGTDLSTAEDQLDDLCRDHLLQQGIPRYTFHDLVRAYAAGRALDEEPPPQRRAALTRLFDYYLSTAATAMDLAYPHERRYRPKVSTAGTHAFPLADRAAADRWLDTELANLLSAAQHAAEHDRPEHTWRLSAILDWHLRTRGHHQDAGQLHRQALHLARHLGNHEAETDALNSLGFVDAALGRYEQAESRHSQALQIAQTIGHPRCEMDALTGLGSVDLVLGRCEQAEAHHGQALQIAQSIGDQVGEWYALTGLGYVDMTVGRYKQAGVHHGQALQIAQSIGDRVGELTAQTGLGFVELMLGHCERAGAHHGQALRIARSIGDRVGELTALTGLGYVERRLGRYGPAGDHYDTALRIARDLGHSGGELQSLHGLGEVHRMRGHHGRAAGCHQQVLDLGRKLGYKNWQFEALQGLGRLHLATGHPGLALTHHEQALQYATELAQPADQARAHDGLAHAHQALHHRDRARRHWQLALDLLTGLGTEHTDDVEASAPNIRAHLGLSP